MFEIIESATFSKWLSGLKDQQARMRIYVRLDRLSLGNFGDAGPIGEGLSELRIHYGPGYRLYYSGATPAGAGGALKNATSRGLRRESPADAEGLQVAGFNATRGS